MLNILYYYGEVIFVYNNWNKVKYKFNLKSGNSFDRI